MMSRSDARRGWRCFTALACAGLFSAAAVHAQTLQQYRGYLLGSSLADVLASTGAPAGSVATQHERPSRLQSLDWRPPYTRHEGTEADPVERIEFSFVDGQLYQVAVEYDRARIASLSEADLVGGVEAVYGSASAGKALPAGSPAMPEGSIVLARWGDDRATLTLFQAPYGDTALLLRHTSLGRLASQATAAGRAQDVRDAPARAAADAAAAATAREAERARHRAAFKP